MSEEPRRSWGRGLVDRGLVEAPSVFFLVAVLGWLFCFGSLVVLDVARLLFVVIHVICEYGGR